jgi:predicted RNase H-like nuclease (RuvC/YqgF family)
MTYLVSTSCSGVCLYLLISINVIQLLQDAQLARQQSLSSISSSGPPSPISSSNVYVPSQDEILERSLHSQPLQGSMSLSIRPERSGGVRTTLQPVMENLQAQLKQREGELQSLQSQVMSLEKTRGTIGEELVVLSTKNNELSLTVTRLSEYQTQYQELEQRYAALLQMYGEKEEEAEELRLDLQDVKSMYRQQIQQLLQQSEASNR